MGYYMLAPYFRRKDILSLLQKNEVMTVSDLSKALNVSLSTARRDVNLMLVEGSVERLRGGAFRISRASPVIPPEMQPTAPQADHSDTDAKTRLAQKAARRGRDNEIIFVDSGSTLRRIPQFITAQNVTLVVRSLAVLETVPQNGSISVILLGGEYLPDLRAVNGPITDTQISNMYFNRVFLGANAYSLDENSAYVYDIREAYVKQLVKKRSEKVYFLAETSKCSQVDFYRAFSLDGCVLINEYTSEDEIADPV